MQGHVPSIWSLGPDGACPQTESFCPQTESFCSQTEFFCSRTESFCSRTEFSVRGTRIAFRVVGFFFAAPDLSCRQTESFCSETESFCLPTEFFCLPTESFCLRTEFSVSGPGPALAKACLCWPGSRSSERWELASCELESWELGCRELASCELRSGEPTSNEKTLVLVSWELRSELDRARASLRWSDSTGGAPPRVRLWPGHVSAAPTLARARFQWPGSCKGMFPLVPGPR